MDKYGVYSEFDAEMHKKTFVNYLEVVIEKDGSVHYAVPSHQEYMIALACKTHDCSRDELSKMCPREYYFDFMTWLCKMTGAVSVWEYNVLCDTLNRKQYNKIKSLKLEGLYKGVLPNITV